MKLENSQQSLTLQEIEDFLQAMQRGGLSTNTIRRYRIDLRKLQQFLGPGGNIGFGTLAEWQEDMRCKGYAPRTICARISTADRYLIYQGKMQLSQPPPTQYIYTAQMETSLTKAEYQELLRFASTHGYEQETLLIRLFAETAIPVKDISQLTVSEVRSGKICLGSSRCRTVQLPPSLYTALETYINKQKPPRKLVFATRAGRPITRSEIILRLQKLAYDAGLTIEKCSPRCLQKLSKTVAPHQSRAAAEQRVDAQAATLRVEQAIQTTQQGGATATP